MKLILILLIILCNFCCLGQTTIGDVKYSPLDPDTFMKLNPGWVLMDGGASKESDSLFKISKLHLVYKLPKLPDGRGVFIRGMNMNKKDSGDVDLNRTVGSWQADTLKRHKHDIKIEVTKDGDAANPRNRVRGGEPNGNGKGMSASEDNIGDDETRPRNIVLYVYIKID